MKAKIEEMLGAEKEKAEQKIQEEKAKIETAEKLIEEQEEQEK